MKKILKAIYSFIKTMGRARAASQLTRMGLYKKANDLM